MIGSQEEAEACFEVHSGRSNDEVHYVDKGLFRKVYRVGTVVYKIVQLDYHGGYCWYSTGGDETNKREHGLFQEYINETWSSESSLYTVDNHAVICMPFFDIKRIDGFSYGMYEPELYPHKREKDSIMAEVKEIKSLMTKYFQKHGCLSLQNRVNTAGTDLHPGNWRILDNGILKLLDGGGG